MKMKYKVIAKRVGDIISPATIKVREKGLGRFFVPNEDREIYRVRAKAVAEEFGFAIYNPLSEEGYQNISIGRS